jgi:hypothetical protein
MNDVRERGIEIGDNQAALTTIMMMTTSDMTVPSEQQTMMMMQNMKSKIMNKDDRVEV